MGLCIQTVKNKIKPQNQHQGDVDPNQKEFNANDDHMLDECVNWQMSNYIDKSHFKFIKIIGYTESAMIWLVEKRKSIDLIRKEKLIKKMGNKVDKVVPEKFIMKVFDKRLVFETRSTECLKNEMDILSKVCYPFLINLAFAFNDPMNAYMVEEYLRGGSLKYHMDRGVVFDEKQTQFIIACVILTLEFLHNNAIIHRNITPDNIYFDETGYAKICNFGHARVWRELNAADTSGTPGYIAPEIMMRQNHSTSIDFFSIGCMTHKFMLGTTPWNDSSREAYKEDLISRQVILKKNDTKENWQNECSDFINKCIKRKTSERLGLNGASEMKNHIWFREFDWRGLQHRKLKPHWIPPRGDNYNKKDAKEAFRLDKERKKGKVAKFLETVTNDDSFQDCYGQFYFDRDLQMQAKRQADPMNKKAKELLRDFDATRL